MKAVLKWGAIGFVVLVVIVAIAGGGSDKKSNEEGAQPAAPPAAPAETAPAATTPPAAAARPRPAAKPSCGNRASDDCTPHVASNKSVRVDALTWRATHVRVAKTLGETQFGTGATADGRFVIVKLRVTSDRDESATLSDNVIQIETADGRKYDADLEGTTAALTSGEDPLFLETLGPDQSTTSTVVFDLPQKVIAERPSLRFNELGFGSTHGYIRLPQAT